MLESQRLLGILVTEIFSELVAKILRRIALGEHGRRRPAVNRAVVAREQDFHITTRSFLEFFFSSRRRHTRSVSAFLLNRSSDLMRLKKRLLAFSRRLHARIRKTRYMHKMRCLLINRRSLLLALRLLWKTPIFPSNSRFPRLCAKCLLKLKRLVSILPMTKSK